MCCDSTTGELATASEELQIVRRAKLQELYEAEKQQSVNITQPTRSRHNSFTPPHIHYAVSLVAFDRQLSELRKLGLAVAGPNIA